MAKGKKFGVYNIPFNTQADFNREVNTRAQQAYLPKLQNINSQIASEGRATAQRGQDIKDETTNWNSQLSQAYDQASKALDTLYGTSGTGDEQNAVLNAAQASQGKVDQTSAAYGGPAPQGTQAVQQAATEGGAERTNYLGGMIANILGGAKNYQATVPQALQNSELATEDRRHQGVDTQLQGQKTDVLGTVGAARSQARSDLQNEILKQRAQQFQEFVGQRQLGQKDRALTIQSDLGWAGVENQKQQLALSRNQFDWSKYVDGKKLNQTQQQLDNAAAQNQGSADAADRQAKANMFAKGAAAVDQFLAANEGDKTTMRKKVNGKAKTVTQIDNELYRSRRTPDQLYSALRRLALPSDMIYQLMSTVRIPGFVEYVRQRKGYPGGTGQGSIQRNGITNTAPLSMGNQLSPGP